MRYSVVLIAAIAVLAGCQSGETTDAAGDTGSLNADAAPADDGADSPETSVAKAPTWVFKKILREHTDWVRGVAFSPDSKLMASAGDDSKIRIWDTLNWELLRTLNTETSVRGIAFSKDGEKLVMAGFGSIHVLDAQTGDEQQKFDFHVLYGFAFEPEQNLAAACADKESGVWDVGAGEVVAMLDGHTDLIACVAFSKQGVLATGSHDKLIKLWNPRTKQELGVLRGQDGLLACLAFSPDGKTLASGGHNNEIVLWDVDVRKETKRLKCDNIPKAFAFSADGKTLVEGRWNGNVYLWDVASGENVATLEEGESSISGIAISPDGKHLATAELNNTITVWDRQ